MCLSRRNTTTLALLFIFPALSSTSGRQSPFSLLIQVCRREFCLHCINIPLGRIFSGGKKVFPERTEILRGLARCIVLIWLFRVMKSKQTFINKYFHTSSALSSWAQHWKRNYNAVTLRSFLCLSQMKHALVTVQYEYSTAPASAKTLLLEEIANLTDLPS